ncbi:MAG: hypothetical protein V7750_15110 [Sneathiella sp.]
MPEIYRPLVADMHIGVYAVLLLPQAFSTLEERNSRLISVTTLIKCNHLHKHALAD